MKTLLYSIMILSVFSADPKDKTEVKEGQLGTAFIASIAVPKYPNIQINPPY